MYRIRRIFAPEIYQGRHRQKRYFEGWYYKCISQDRQSVLAVIPGIAMDPAGEKHAFIQIINARTGRCHYFRFPFAGFAAGSKNFTVQIDQNAFSRTEMTLDLKQEAGSARGQLVFSNIIPYPKRLLAPGIMGPYAFLPFMECYHAIINIRHEIHGYLELDGENFDFDGGTGYLEKDYGRSFPASWVWLQAGHFTRNDAVFMFSRAAIPFLGSTFQGFISFLLLDGRLHRFATYNRTRLQQFEINREQMTVEATLSSRQGTVHFRASHRGGGVLKAPKNGSMQREIRESISGSVDLSWTDPTGRILFSGTSSEVGMEISDD